MLNQDQLEKKYHISFVGSQRYYKQSLLEKDYSLENTTPFILEAGNKSFMTTSWKQLLLDVCREFLTICPQKRTELLDFKPSWTDMYQFKDWPDKNWELVGEDIYLSCNHTAVHAFWLLRELLELFGVDLSKCNFLIHRSPIAEPKECREYFEEKTKSGFKYYYTHLLKKSEEKADQVIRNIEKLNRLLKDFSRSYDSFFLFDSNNVYSSYKGKFLDYLRYKTNIDEKNIEIAEKYLTVLGTFYKDIR